MPFCSKAWKAAKPSRATPSWAAIHFWSAATARATCRRFMQNLRATLERFKSVTIPNLPPFTGGAVGYFGYDMVRTIEDIPDTGRDDLGVDDAVLMFYKTVLAFDHLRHQIHIISNLLVDESQRTARTAIRAGNGGNPQDRSRSCGRRWNLPSPQPDDEELQVRSNFEKSDYLKAVATAKEYIAAGDIFQVVLSQRFEVDLKTLAVRDLSRASDRESLAVHVLPEDAGRRRSSDRLRKCW